MLTKITLTNFLSYGPGPQPIDLRPLNVLIGANGSGKSNLVEALSVLRAVPRDVTLPIRRGGGVEEWFWRGDPPIARADASTIEVTFESGRVSKEPIRYALEFESEAGAFVVSSERLVDDLARQPEHSGYLHASDGVAALFDLSGEMRVEPTRFDRTHSVLAQLRDPVAYPEVSAVGDALKRILIYRAWSFGPDANIRESCRADVETSTLLEDFSNLPARLAVLKRDPATKRRLLELLREVSPAYNDIEVTPEGGRLQLYVTEGERNVPAHRLSDGTLRYLALLAILLQPGANLVVIEEPELGLHPDMFPTLRDLLVEASERFQLVVTTHSTQLVDGLTDHAESVLVCEKENGTTRLVRLDQSDVDAWREQGALGLQWMSGRHGGTRW
jgi:predicted ATPase